MALNLKRCSDGFDNIPASFLSSPYGVITYPVLHTPVFEAHSSTADNHHPGSRVVPGLFVISRPSTVLGRIALSVVDSIKRMSRGGFVPHVFKKVWEAILRVTPALADLDALTAVPSISSVIGVVTAPEHISPRPVNLPILTHRKTMLVPVGFSTFFGISHTTNYSLICRGTQ